MVTEVGKKSIILPIFLSHMGCPHTCVFCNQHTIAGEPAVPEEKELLSKCSAWKKSSGVTPELAFYGGSFTALPLDLQVHCLSLALRFKDAGLISGVRLSTRPDALSSETLNQLKKYKVDCVEIGAQSFSNAVLSASGRGHDAACLRRAIESTKQAGLKCGVQLMVGLPEDTPFACLAGAYEAVNLGVDSVRIYPTVVLENTALADAFRRGRFIPWDLEKVVSTSAGMLAVFEKAGIPVLRIGLQDVLSLHSGEVVAGSHHPAMGELVRSRLWRDRLLKLWQEDRTGDIFFVQAHPALYSQLVGHGGCNKDYFMNKLGVELSIIPASTLPEGTIKRGGAACT